jgi:uncharacterized protein YuzE
MASQDGTLDLDYDEQNDVLYGSLGSPRATLSYEISKDVWLDYIPPNKTVVGITVLGFSKHYPIAHNGEWREKVQSIVQDLLQKYPSVPDYVPVTILIDPTPWLQIFSTAAAGIHAMPLTHAIGLSLYYVPPRIEGNRVPSGDVVV